MLILSFLFTTSNITVSSNPTPTDQYITHDPIVINSNRDFIDQGFPGYGNETHPYLIEGYEIFGDQTGYLISISHTTAHFVVRDNFLDNGTRGINLLNVSNALITANEVTNTKYSIYMLNSTLSSITSNSIYTRSETSLDYGIFAQYCDDIIISYNSINGNQNSEIGIRIKNTLNSSIHDNNITNSDSGIWSNYLNNSRIYHNNINQISRTIYSNGIVTAESKATVIENNYIEDYYYAIWTRFNTNTPILSNTLVHSSYGVYALDSQNLTFSHNISPITSGSDIRFENVRTATIYNNTNLIIGGFYLYHSTDLNIEDNTRFSFYGVSIDNTSVHSNTLAHTSLVSSHNVSFTKNIFNTLDADYGINLDYSNNNTFTDSIIFMDPSLDYLIYGIKSVASSFNTFVNITVPETATHGIEDLSGTNNTYLNSTVLDSENGNFATDSVNTTAMYNNFIGSQSRSVVNDGLDNTFYFNYYGDANLTDVDFDGIADQTYNTSGTVPLTDPSPQLYPLGAQPEFDPPVIFTDSPASYVVNTTGHTIDWEIIEEYPNFYEVYRNGTMIQNGTWTDTVSVNIDGLNVSRHNYTIIAYDLFGNVATDTIYITVKEPYVPPARSTPQEDPVESGSSSLDEASFPMIELSLIVLIPFLVKKRNLRFERT